MQELGIQAVAKRKYKATTDSRHSRPVAENHLNRQFTPKRPNQYWVSDITYIYTKEGWLYLATIMDLYSRKIIGWSLRERLTKELIIAALHMALKQRKITFLYRLLQSGGIRENDQSVLTKCPNYRGKTRDDGNGARLG